MKNSRFLVYEETRRADTIVIELAKYGLNVEVMFIFEYKVYEAQVKVLSLVAVVISKHGSQRTNIASIRTGMAIIEVYAWLGRRNAPWLDMNCSSSVQGVLNAKPILQISQGRYLA